MELELIQGLPISGEKQVDEVGIHLTLQPSGTIAIEVQGKISKERTVLTEFTMAESFRSQLETIIKNELKSINLIP